MARRIRIASTVRAAVAALALAWVAGCAPRPVVQPEDGSFAAAPEEQWFQCYGRFDCVVVFDSGICESRAVNASYALVYETWATQSPGHAGDSRECAPDPDAELRAVCRKRRCSIAESNLDALIEYAR